MNMFGFKKEEGGLSRTSSDTDEIAGGVSLVWIVRAIYR